MNPQDIFYILKWFLGFFAIGVAFLPLTFSLFNDFKDKGYIFSKIIGLAILSYLIFVLGTLHILKFSLMSILVLLILTYFINYWVYRKNNIITTIKKNIKVFIFEETIFLAALFLWSYVRSNIPDIHGLEKFMDFGFLNSILRSDYFPPKDMWYTPFPINYYYFGHLMTAVVTKLINIPSFITYNLMIATLFALTFTASLSFGLNLFERIKISIKSVLAGILSAVLVSLAGNLTTIYTFFKPYVNDNPVPFWKLPFLPFSFPNNYWYPNATRFIPYTIHEFPTYSFVVSDLHGHVLDIPLVLLTISVIFSYLNKKINFLNLLFLSFIFSIMYMTNAWDGLIYFLLASLLFVFLNFYKEHNRWNFSESQIYKFLKNIFILLAGFFVFSLPFSIHFKPFVSGIGIICAPDFLTKLGEIGPFLFEANHCQKSPIWQLVILYGFFYFFVISFILFLKSKKNFKISENYLFVLILIILSSLLIILPEFIYVKDIYPLHYRANTMFKLVYEAFIMLSLSSGFVIVTLISNIKSKKILFPFFILSSFLLFLVLIYPNFAINSYYKNLSTYESLNGTKYLSTLYPGDYNLINWIDKNITGQPVILEANGDSYTDYARISSNTGLPTVIGWPVHEWLWRGTYDIVSPRITDVQKIYTSKDLEEVKSLLKKYNISYVVVSSLEVDKYPNLNEKNFQKLGVVTYQNAATKLYKINN